MLRFVSWGAIWEIESYKILVTHVRYHHLVLIYNVVSPHERAHLMYFKISAMLRFVSAGRQVFKSKKFSATYNLHHCCERFAPADTKLDSVT